MIVTSSSVFWRRMVEGERRTAGWQSWVTVRALTCTADCGGWKENVMSKPYCLMAWRDIDTELCYAIHHRH